MTLTTHHCSTCGQERAFERPPCADGHDPECLEWACLDCGEAILTDIVIVADAPPRAA